MYSFRYSMRDLSFIITYLIIISKFSFVKPVISSSEAKKREVRHCGQDWVNILKKLSLHDI